MNFLQTFEPNPIAFAWGPITVYWYGIFLAIGSLLAVVITIHLANHAHLPVNKLIDWLFLILVIGFLGARLYHVLNEPAYYWENPDEIIKIWHGGLAIHGGLIAGLLVLWLGARKMKVPLLKLTDVMVPGLILAQAIGRWGNYFNQELFGRPTDLPWGILINPSLRPPGYEAGNFFHPAFLYEFVIDLIGFFILWYLIKKAHSASSFFNTTGITTSLYFIIYGLGRFIAEIFRIDPTPSLLGLRLPLIISIFIILVGATMLRMLRKRTRLAQTTANDYTQEGFS
ncbi:MAG: prolipoprotein diacylglyceryl transferase [bacterium]